MFRFAARKEKALMALGTIFSIVIAAALPIFSILWGNMTDAFRNQDEMVSQALTIFVQYIIFGVIAIFAGWGMNYFWLAAAESQANNCRKAFFDALLRQEVGWF
jgi:ATP-binding cassette subfamily B (MDR/TAP) protein 1